MASVFPKAHDIRLEFYMIAWVVESDINAHPCNPVHLRYGVTDHPHGYWMAEVVAVSVNAKES
jgi:hypothetical protein